MPVALSFDGEFKYCWYRHRSWTPSLFTDGVLGTSGAYSGNSPFSPFSKFSALSAF